MKWNSTDRTVDLGIGGGSITLQIGMEDLIQVYNNTGTPFADGQVVRVTGSQGQRITAALAQANSEASANGTIAIVTESIGNNSEGFATTRGLVRDLNTLAFAEGALLYLSPSVSGGITSTEPTAPNHTVYVGWCIRSHGTQGSIYVKIQNGYELDELHNVSITSVQDNDLLSYETSSGLWKNKAVSGIGEHEIWMMSSGMTPAKTDPATVVEYSAVTNTTKISCLSFSPTVSQFAHFSIKMPKSWNESSVKFIPVWLTDGTGDVNWTLQANVGDDGDTLDATFASAVTVTDTALSTPIGKRHFGSKSSAVSMNGTISANAPALIDFRMGRDVADSLSTAALLLGVSVFYTTDVATDA
jgi:ribosomal protein L35AE/L33A